MGAALGTCTGRAGSTLHQAGHTVGPLCPPDTSPGSLMGCWEGRWGWCQLLTHPAAEHAHPAQPALPLLRGHTLE